MSRSRKLSRATQRKYAGQKGPNGRNLCSWCGTEVKPPRRTFCGDACVHEWKIRNDPGYVRIELEKRDHGICGTCGADCARIARIAHILLYEPDDKHPHPAWCRERYNTYMCQHPNHKMVREFLEALGFDRHRRNLWDADHILEVVNGGGECGLENYQTLCQPCHKAKTKRLAGERAAARKAEKDKPAI